MNIAPPVVLKAYSFTSTSPINPSLYSVRLRYCEECYFSCQRTLAITTTRMYVGYYLYTQHQDTHVPRNQYQIGVGECVGR